MEADRSKCRRPRESLTVRESRQWRPMHADGDNFYDMHNPGCVMISRVFSTEASAATRTCRRLDGPL
jgi:hypothetical protein